MIKTWLEEHFDIDGAYTIDSCGSMQLVNVEGSVKVKRYSRDEMLSLHVGFGTVTGDFSLELCYNLEELYGCPETVGGTFNVDGCRSLFGLAGAPRTADVVSCLGCSFRNLQMLPSCRQLWLTEYHGPIPFAELKHGTELIVSDRQTIAPEDLRICLVNRIAISDTADKPVPEWQKICNAYYTSGDLLAAMEAYENLTGQPFNPVDATPAAAVEDLHL